MALDPSGDCLYVSDGWGVSYPATRLRRLSLRTGAELQTTRLGSSPRCLAFSETDPSHFLVAGDKKLFLLDRDTLKPIRRWSTGVPSYSDRMVWDGRRAVLANWRAPTVTIFDTKTGSVRKRRKLAGGIAFHPLSSEELLICCAEDATIWKLWIDSCEVVKIMQASSFFYAALDREHKLWLSLGAWMSEDRTSSKMTVRQPPPTALLRRHTCLEMPASLDDFQLDFLFWRIGFSENSHELWTDHVTPTTKLTHKEQRMVATYAEVLSMPQLTRVATVTTGGHDALKDFFPDAGIARGPSNERCTATRSSPA